jgi:hypothetical protein
MNFTSLTVSFKATYSACVLDKRTQGWALDFQEIGKPHKNMTKPVILFRSSLSPAKSKSLYPSIFQLSDVSELMFNC